MHKKYALQKLFQHGYVSVFKYDNGDYKLNVYGRMNGGDLIGANIGFYAGKFAVHFVTHGTIAIINLCISPAVTVLASSLEATCLLLIENYK